MEKEEITCEYCGNQFNNYNNLIRHQKRSIKCKNQQNQLDQENLQSQKLNVCSNCSNSIDLENKPKIYCNNCFMSNIIFMQNEKLKNDIIQLKEIIDKLVLEKESINTEKGHLIIKVAQLEGKLTGIFEGFNAKSPINPNNTINNKIINKKELVYIKLKNLDVSTIEPFILETVEKRLKNGKYSYKLFQKSHPGVSEFLKLIIKKGEERSYVCNEADSKKFYRLFTKGNSEITDSELPSGWVKDYGAEFLKKIIPMLETYADKYKDKEIDEINEDIKNTFGDDCGSKESDNEYKQLLKQKEDVDNFYKCFCCSKKTGMPTYPTEHSKLLKYLIKDLKTFSAI